MVNRVMAGCLALAAFAIAIFAGLAAGNEAGLVLVRALMAMILCYPVGFIIGMICDNVIAGHAEAKRAAEEAPSADANGNDDTQAASSEEVTIV